VIGFTVGALEGKRETKALLFSSWLQT
jgi:hypothetical protein